MLSLSRNALLKLYKTTSPLKLFPSDCITLYVKCNCLGGLLYFCSGVHSNRILFVIRSNKIYNFISGNPAQLDKRRGGVALPGLSSSRDDHTHRWSPRYEEQMHKWQDRSSPCERPRTYDRFYQKLPGNFQEPQTDSAISVCSSEENEKVVNSDKKKRKTKKSERQSRKDLHYSKTLTEHDVRHLERHLSMKRTIRKKIMRDLQQAFVQDPKEFTKVTRRREINMKSLNFDRKTGTGQSEPNFLDMLRDSDDSGNGSPIRYYEN